MLTVRCGCPGNRAEEPGQSRGGGERVLRDARLVLPASPDARRGHQRPRDSQTEPGGHLEVSVSPTDSYLLPHSLVTFSLTCFALKRNNFFLGV